VGCAYLPTDTLLELLSVTHVHKTTTELIEDRVFGAEFGTVDLVRDEVPDDVWHSIYRRRMINNVLDWEEE
jgi:hypothetical protein